MGNILFASVPLSGHVNPAIAIARRLVEQGHSVIWYGGKRFRSKIEASGALFAPYKKARDFDDRNIKLEFPRLPENNLLRHSMYYIRHVFYDSMLGQVEDLSEILADFKADVIVTDEWFTGAQVIVEKNKYPWIVYSSAPLMLLTDEFPPPGSGLGYRTDLFGRRRNHIVNWISQHILFRPIEKYINRLRIRAGISRLDHPFLENTIFHSTFFIIFNSPAFEYKWESLPRQIKFVGPILPESEGYDYPWIKTISKDKPLIFITQGSVDIKNYKKLIVPALEALSNMNVNVAVTTGGCNTRALNNKYGGKNIFIEEYIPYSMILPHCDIMITNGGFGGVACALSWGVPLIVAGNSEDKPVVASRIVYTGAGIDLNSGNPSPRSIQKAVECILSDQRYKEVAESIKSDFAQYEAISETCHLINSVITKV